MSVAEYLNIPRFDESNVQIRAIRDLSLEITARLSGALESELLALDEHVKKLLNF
ncbi:hypothetical protein [Pseudomonas sp.]|uniref:hypothetical protein n=1 Tax=Pseudomonas sp. TaxID=306 RepID=UPI003D6FAFE7